MKYGILIIPMIVLMSIGMVSAMPIPIELDVNILHNGNNIDTSTVATVYYYNEDAGGNPVPESLNTNDDACPPICWGIYLGKSNLYATFWIKPGTDVTINIQGYPNYTFSNVNGNIGPLDINVNGPPTVSDVVISPDPAYTNYDLTGSGTYSDPEGDPESGSTFRWYKNGEVIPGETGTTLDSSNFLKGNSIIFEYTPKDGTDFGAPVNSTPLVISDTPPTPPTLSSITPDTAYKTSTLSTTASESMDIDGDGITYLYQWRDSDDTTVLQDWSVTNTFDCSASAPCTKGDTIYVHGKAHTDDANSTDVSKSRLISNSPPVLNPIGDKSVNESQLLQFDVSATDDDPEDTTLTYTADNLPAGASFVGQTFTWTPTYDQAGTYDVTFNVSDGPDKDSETITITVNNVNRAPEITWFAPSNETTLETRDTTDLLFFGIFYNLLFNHTSEDPDGGGLIYSWKLDGAVIPGETGTTWLYSPPEADCGSRIVLLTVSDGSLTATQSWDVTVKLRGDVNGDGEVGITDLAMVGLAYGSTPDDLNWNEDADLHVPPKSDGTPEGNDRIDIFDLATVGLNYGRTC